MSRAFRMERRSPPASDHFYALRAARDHAPEQLTFLQQQTQYIDIDIIMLPPVREPMFHTVWSTAFRDRVKRYEPDKGNS